MGYRKFKVTALATTKSGTYAVYVSETGTTTLTTNYNFKEGDIVEQWDYDGYCPREMKVNGEIIWTQEDARKFWAERGGLQAKYQDETAD